MNKEGKRMTSETKNELNRAKKRLAKTIALRDEAALLSNVLGEGCYCALFKRKWQVLDRRIQRIQMTIESYRLD